jgi:alkanesulfonate monooxygenase SsuD/methylene tetrahydromethanopterin reductase-like flavin-dependent oxidoreductase (luciferase family)
MQLGLHALGIGPGAHREVIDAVAVAAEAEGFSTLWSGEHVVMVDRSESHYPYSACFWFLSTIRCCWPSRRRVSTRFPAAG